MKLTSRRLRCIVIAIRLAAVAAAVATSTVAALASPVASHGAAIPNYIECSITRAVTYTNSATVYRQYGSITVNLTVNRDRHDNTACSYYASASELNGPSGTLTVEVRDTTSSSGNCQWVEVPSASTNTNGNGSATTQTFLGSPPAEGYATFSALSTTNVATSCTS